MLVVVLQGHSLRKEISKSIYGVVEKAKTNINVVGKIRNPFIDSNLTDKHTLNKS